jgi:hypothetical protein
MLKKMREREETLKIVKTKSFTNLSKNNKLKTSLGLWRNFFQSKIIRTGQLLIFLSIVYAILSMKFAIINV